MKNKDFSRFLFCVCFVIGMSACAPRPQEVVIVFPTSIPEPTPTERLLVFSTPEYRTWDDILEGRLLVCEVDWSWGGATLQIYGYGRGGLEVCENLIANGEASFGETFLLSENGTSDDEDVLCWLKGKELVYLIWDEPSWQAGGEFCDFLTGFDELP